MSGRWILALLAGLVLCGCDTRSGSGSVSGSAPANRTDHVLGVTAAKQTIADVQDAPDHAAPNFATREKLREHYRKHGSEFGSITMQEYLELARHLRGMPAGGDVEEIRRPGGDVARFDRSTGEFGVFESDGTIRTFFKPRDGETYFRRQARRHGD